MADVVPLRPRPSPAVIKSRKREIRHRPNRNRLRKQPRTLAAIRVSELTRLFDRRYGNVLLPPDDAGRDDARLMVHHLAALDDAKRRIDSWLHTCAPWMPLAEREHLIADATEKRLRWSADKLAWKLRLTAAERDELGIRTIGAVDMSKAERAARRKDMDRERQRTKRRQTGGKTRAQYEAASIAKAKPWITEGISRATWYRRNKAP